MASESRTALMFLPVVLWDADGTPGCRWCLRSRTLSLIPAEGATMSPAAACPRGAGPQRALPLPVGILASQLLSPFPEVPPASYPTGALSPEGAGDPPETPRDEYFWQLGDAAVSLAELHLPECPVQSVSLRVDPRFLGEVWRVEGKPPPFCTEHAVAHLLAL